MTVWACRAECATKNNSRLCLTVAINYSGRDDIVRTAQRIADKISSGELSLSKIDANVVSRHLSLSHILEKYREPDLLIRTGGEKRISNFMLWELAYTELYFTDVLWPDFNQAHFLAALDEYKSRERRFGRRI